MHWSAVTLGQANDIIPRKFKGEIGSLFDPCVNAIVKLR